jgi:sugar lactone lactonase YvrE
MRNLRRALLGLAVAGLVVGQGPGAAAAPAGHDRGGLDTFDLVTAFDPGPGGAFAESMAPDGQGGMVVSVTQWGAPVVPDNPDGPWTPNSGQLWRVQPDGTRATFGPEIALGDLAMLTGVEVDDHGRVFVGVFNFAVENALPSPEVPASGILRVTESSADYVMTLPEISMPNEVVEHAGSLYVTDSQNGYIWKGSVSRPRTPRHPWFECDLLTPDTGTMGANGITFGNDALYVSSYDRGLILRIPVGPGASSGRARVVAEDPVLVGADGIRFDRRGRLWVAVSGTYDDSDPEIWPPPTLIPPEIVVVGTYGSVSTIATPDESLDYPTAVAFGDRGAVFVLNGSYFNFQPNLVALTR